MSRDEPSAPPQGAPSWAGDRRTVTVLFADLSDFTTMAERLDPEVVTTILRECLPELEDEVRAHDGWVKDKIGDAILAVFGAPTAHDDDPVRAVHAALGMRDRIEQVNRRLEPRVGHPLRLHIGVNTGHVVFGPTILTPGRSHDADLAVVGDAVNLGARLQHAAGPGQILVGQATHAATKHLFEYRRLSPFKAKGKHAPVVAYECLGSGIGADANRPIAPIGAPMLGRDSEFSTLIGLLERLQNGEGGILSVIGEPGLGKSRLLAEARGWAADKNLHWLEGGALSFGRAISYWPFLELVRSDADIREEDEDESWQKLERRATELFPEGGDEVLPYLAALLGVEIQGELVEKVRYLDGEAMGRQIFRAARLFFARLAEVRPLILVFEDAHWIDASSAALLEHLLPLVARTRLLICAASRPDPGTPAVRLRELARSTYEGRCTELVLSPLSRGESAELVRDLLRLEAVPPSVEELVSAKAEGNPFFIEEVVRSLFEQGVVVRDSTSGQLEITRGLDAIVVPETLRGVIAARIDRLDGSEREVIRAASVIGRSFSYRVLRAIVEDRERLDDALGALEQLELLRETSRTPEREYSFKHALTQESAYVGVLLERRLELHRRVGASLEDLYEDRLEELYPLLAYHFGRAEDWEKAQAYLFKAGDQAGHIAADAEALAHYHEAVAAYERAFGDRWDRRERTQLERKIAEALFRRGDNAQAIEQLKRVLALAGYRLPTSGLGVKLGIVRGLLRQIGRFPLPDPRLAEHVDPVAREAGLAFHLLAWIEFFEDQERYFLVALMQTNHGERAGYGPGISRGSQALGYSLDALSLARSAGRYHRRAVRVGERSQDPVSVGQAYLSLGMHELAVGRWEVARQHLARSGDISRDVGDLRGWAAGEVILALGSLLRGDLDSGLVGGEEVSRVGEEGGDHQIAGWGLGMLGTTLGLMGRLDEGVATLRDGIESAKRVPDSLTVLVLSGFLSTLLLRSGRLDEAREVCEEGDRILTGSGLRGLLLTPFHEARAELRLAVAESTHGRERAPRLREARRACRAALHQRRVDRASAAGAWRLVATHDWLRGRRRLALRRWRRSLALAESRDLRYQLGLTHLEIGRRTGSPDHLRKAEEVFVAIGDKLDLATTREVLSKSFQTAD